MVETIEILCSDWLRSKGISCFSLCLYDGFCVQELFLALNNISDFSSLISSVLLHCPRLEVLSLSDCPISQLCTGPSKQISLRKLNLSDTAVASWEEVERLRTFTSLTDLRMMDCPFNKVERSLLVADATHFITI